MVPSRELRAFLKLIGSVRTGLSLNVRHFEFKDGEWAIV
jgi:hypothetical protein